MRAAAAEAAAELREAPRELAVLYNDYTAPWRLWGTALQLVELARFQDAAFLRHLWDVFLRQARC